jgi:hypothetical protein
MVLLAPKIFAEDEKMFWPWWIVIYCGPLWWVVQYLLCWYL